MDEAVGILDATGALEVLERVSRQVLELLQAVLDREKAAAPRALPPLPEDARLAAQDQRGQRLSQVRALQVRLRVHEAADGVQQLQS